MHYGTLNVYMYVSTFVLFCFLYTYWYIFHIFAYGSNLSVGVQSTGLTGTHFK